MAPLRYPLKTSTDITILIPEDVKAKTNERGRVVLTTKKAHRLLRSEHSPNAK